MDTDSGDGASAASEAANGGGRGDRREELESVPGLEDGAAGASEAGVELGGQRLPTDPEELEIAYQHAVRSGRSADFARAVEERYAEQPDDPLTLAWHYRLAYAVRGAASRAIAWRWALPLALLNAAVLWALSDVDRYMLRVTNPLNGRQHDLVPAVVLLAAPITAAVVIAFLTGAGGGRWRRPVAAWCALAAVAAVVLLAYPHVWPRPFQEQFAQLMVGHVALIAWALIGWVALLGRHDAESRFAFLLKSFEAAVVAGLLVIAGAVFVAITAGLFNALGIELPEVIVRLFTAGGAGLIAVVAVALVYEPGVEPTSQSFDEGPSRLIAQMMRLLLPLAIGVLIAYLAFIPLRFREPFENREVLVAYSAMLFAVLALLIGAAPVRRMDPPGRASTWLRRGIVVLAGLALVVGLYALAALVYRTAVDQVTPNRLAFIGWSVVNLAVLAGVIVLQARSSTREWVPALHRSLAAGVVPYTAWGVAVLLLVPALFAGGPGYVAGLPASIQEIVYEDPEPILLKCTGSPHIYLLDDGAKRWIQDIPTFQSEGFKWNDVRFVSCVDIESVPDGKPIPPDAGTPPAP